MKLRTVIAASHLCLASACNVGPDHAVSDDAPAPLPIERAAAAPALTQCVQARGDGERTFSRTSRRVLDDGRVEAVITVDTASLAQALLGDDGEMPATRRVCAQGDTDGECGTLGSPAAIGVSGMAVTSWAQDVDNGIVELRAGLRHGEMRPAMDFVRAACGTAMTGFSTEAELVGCVGARAPLTVDFIDPELSMRVGLAADIHVPVVTEAARARFSIPRAFVFAQHQPLMFDVATCNDHALCPALSAIARSRLVDGFQAWMFFARDAQLEAAVQDEIARALLREGMLSTRNDAGLALPQLEWVSTGAVLEGVELEGGQPQHGGLRVTARFTPCADPR